MTMEPGLLNIIGYSCPGTDSILFIKKSHINISRGKIIYSKSKMVNQMEY